MRWIYLVVLLKDNLMIGLHTIGGFYLSYIDKAKYYNLIEKSYYEKLGKVSKIVGLTIESVGPDAKLNDLCKIY